MKKSNEKKIANLILCVDFRKAFDSISHTYIQNALKELNFGNDFCDWIRLFFCNREGRILMDGHLTEKIYLEQGVPQGDIISPYIFIIAVEILLIKITTSKNIKGVKIGKKECKAQTFADDTTILIKREEESLRASILYIEEFKRISGLAANLDKTNVIPYGKFFNPGQKICPDLDVNWVDKFKLLGFDIDNKLQQLNINFEKALAKAQNIISNWKARKLPINGRIIISKSLVVSQFNYVASILTPPPSMLSKMQELVNNFIRGGPHHWISDDKLYAPIKSGGLNCI